MAHVDGVEERALRDVSLLRGHVRCAQAVAAVQHLAWDSRCRRTGRGSRRRRGQKGLSTIASCSRLEIRTGPTPTRSARIPTYKYSTFTVLCIQAPVAATCTCVVVILQPPCRSTEPRYPTRCEDLDRFDAVSHGELPAAKGAANGERWRPKVEWSLTGRSGTGRGLSGRSWP